MRFVWQNAHRFSLAHDVSWGGLAKALARPPRGQGSSATDLDFVEGEGHGRVVAYSGEAPDWDDVLELGTV